MVSAQLMFSHMQATEQTDYLMMWVIAFLILLLTPFNEFYDGPINRHAWPDLKSPFACWLWVYAFLISSHVYVVIIMILKMIYLR